MADKKQLSNFWMQTYSNGTYDFENNNSEDINIVDIAHALSQITRFGGHCKNPYTVAQHSLTVAAALEKDGFSKEICLTGLMHDAHEAYIGDITTPFKRFIQHKTGVPFSNLEAGIKQAISKRFGIDIIFLPKAVIRYDEAILRTEAESLFDRIVNN